MILSSCVIMHSFIFFACHFLTLNRFCWIFFRFINISHVYLLFKFNMIYFSACAPICFIFFTGGFYFSYIYFCIKSYFFLPFGCYFGFNIIRYNFFIVLFNICLFVFTTLFSNICLFVFTTLFSNITL